VIAYLVAQRTHELGIRVALGAGKREILRLVMGEGARLAAFGLVLGGLGAAAVLRVLSSALMGIPVSSPVILLISFVLIAGVALGASYLPHGARREWIPSSP
jgi:ABC-type antimicrobial peptide transport system permease subunit